MNIQFLWRIVRFTCSRQILYHSWWVFSRVLAVECRLFDQDRTKVHWGRISIFQCQGWRLMGRQCTTPHCSKVWTKYIHHDSLIDWKWNYLTLGKVGMSNWPKSSTSPLSRPHICLSWNSKSWEWSILHNLTHQNLAIQTDTHRLLFCHCRLDFHCIWQLIVLHIDDFPDQVSSHQDTTHIWQYPKRKPQCLYSWHTCHLPQTVSP